jgi:Domain of unknown function (DUF1918)
MTTAQTKWARASVGDWIEARSVSGQPPRRGQIVGLLGRGDHERYRVRWDENHESILYPADGVVIIPRRQRTNRAGR